jgi:hypothetical protein
MKSAMRVCCDASGMPRTRLHGLRMLNPELFSQLPLSSADSTNVARNVQLDRKWVPALTSQVQSGFEASYSSIASNPTTPYRPGQLKQPRPEVLYRFFLGVLRRATSCNVLYRCGHSGTRRRIVMRIATCRLQSKAKSTTRTPKSLMS